VKAPPRASTAAPISASLFLRGRREAAVVALGRYLVEPLVTRVAPLPAQAPPLRLAEASGRTQGGGGAPTQRREAFLRRARPAARDERVRREPAVDLAEGRRQRRGRQPGVPEDGQQAAGAQRQRGLRRPGVGIDPVPGLGADDGVEPALPRLPVLERRDLDIEPPPPCHRGHANVGVEAEHAAAGGLKAA
jgi:hypothetical protein